MDSLPWLCGGDFNKILSLSEKLEGSDRSVSSMMSFRSDCSLSDLGFSGSLITWNNKQGREENVQERLNRFVGSEDCEGCAAIVQSAWCASSISTDAIADLDSQLSICSSMLKNWSAKEFGSFTKATGKIRKQIRHIYKNSEVADRMEEVRQLECSLEDALLKEETAVIKR
ncbi:hypothetical protein TorRG33x02_178260 [Trema orientale]|uniref:Endonuclease/exonuclease/phosphatase n=1 Tax=Trema orientale TaxID=63057 RepID=A0A2P5ELE9_TREOI|nr:hypothetical protein TorRG33x02_178260 [Trema orientale]